MTSMTFAGKVNLLRKRKLIEVALPLEAINQESAHEKSVPRKGHPATLHLWWARRPLAAARAVLFAQLVDDPSSRPDEFPTEADQRVERERLHSLMVEISRWENSQDTELFSRAHLEILRSCGGNPPSILDPFAGGGTIPVEAQRLGLEAVASDLNPVATLINKALVELPHAWRGRRPVFPGMADSQIRNWTGNEGLAADVRSYGLWMRDQAELRLGGSYPSADGLTVVAWIWTRTVECPNPACRIEMPLIRSRWLSKKKGRETYVTYSVVPDPQHKSGARVVFDIGRGVEGAPTAEDDGTVGRKGASCLACGSPASLNYIRSEGQAKRMRAQLMAVVAEGKRQRVFLAPSSAHEKAADLEVSGSVPSAEISKDGPGAKNVPLYGLTQFSDLFTKRQLAALTVFSDLVSEARDKVIADGGERDYADIVATYLAFLGSKLADWLSSLCSWIPQIEGVRDTFARQALPMVWDFVEINPLSNSVGNVTGHFEWIVASIEALPSVGPVGVVTQANAATRTYTNSVVSTDPPYYDNIGYSDLSDFLYIWLRRSLREIHPELLSTVLVPKADELVANAQRHGGRKGAQQFFEDGFRHVFAHAREAARDDFPITVYYAFKQSEVDSSGNASTGWETLLEGMVRSGWEITSTWPLRSERGGRMISIGANALASSIVLSLRPRPAESPIVDRRGFIAALEAELPGALRKLQQGQIAPVDLPQAAIGPGMAVFSRYSAVLEPDGSKMTVRAALSRINEILDHVLNEQEGDFDPTSRFAIAWYRQCGYGKGAFGDADLLARARNASVNSLDRDGILISRAGAVQLLRPEDLSFEYDVSKDVRTSNWEALHHLIGVLERDGIEGAGRFLRAALSRSDRVVDADLVKELAHLLFRIAESKGWTKDALSFNALVTTWPDISDVARSLEGPFAQQGALDFDEDDDRN
ncbi:MULTISPECIES: DUF1156 domain-containing protein [unclassified Aeromicrobium]|uniref:DUF1156 domain-containing protein n=1 Tax=unclassified Aeromicrobium TaxID=2633570 RepID=UPI002889AA5C|nr:MULTISPECIES: DUF1156 domain-containing protein [unclassified Aeromicrobium]